MIPSLPLSLSFLNPVLAGAGLLLVSIPIIIHLLNRRRFKTVTWAAMDYLLKAMKKNRRRLKFEQWMLLAARCLLLALLGVALARPVGCETRSLAMLGTQTGMTVVVIDNSFSMAYEANRPGAKTHLDRAKQLASELIDQRVGTGESVALITCGSPARFVIAKPSLDLPGAKAAVGRIEQSYGGTDLPGALQLALQIGRDTQGRPGRRLVLVTDATRSAWESSQAQSIKQTAVELAREFNVTHYNLTQDRQQSNAAVLDLKPSANLVTSKFPVDFTAAPKGYGTVPDAALRWKLNDAPLDGAGPIKLDVDTPVQTQTRARFTAGGPQVLSASLDTNDGLNADNARFRVVDVAAELKVLIVEGKRGGSVLEGSGAFLSLALAPATEASSPAGTAKSNSYVAPELISDLELGNKVLSDYSTIVLAGVSQVPPSLADNIEKFVREGGTLMLFMGDDVSRESYNAILEPRGLMPGKIVKVVSAGTDQKGFLFDFNPKGVLHPYLREFANQENAGLNTAQVFKYAQVDVPAARGVERVLNYLPVQPDKDPIIDPAITVHALDQGRVVFVSTTANGDWAASLPAKPAYVPLMHELLAGSVKSGDYWMNRVVGQSVEIPGSLRLTASPTLVDPVGQPVVIEAVASTQAASVASVYRSAPLAKPGVYRLTAGKLSFPIAVNVPADESDVRTINNESVKHAMADIPVTLEGDEAPPLAALANDGNDFAGPVLLAVLCLLGLECFMAMRAGHHRMPNAARAAA